MALRTAPVAEYGPEDCAVLYPYLREGIASVRRGRGTVPERVLDMAAEISRCSAAAEPHVRPVRAAGAEQRNSGALPDGARWPQPDKMLTVAQVAKAGGFSESYARRLMRETAFYAVKAKPAGAWLADAADFARWQRERQSRKEHEREAA